MQPPALGASAYRYCPQCGTALGFAEQGGLLRPSCPSAACGFVLWDNPVPVVAALVEYEGCVVLARNAAWPEKHFGLITGFLERNETPASAVAREVVEELGLRVSATELIGLYEFPSKNQLIIAYHVKAAGEIVLNEELAEFRLIEPERLKAWSFGTGFAVRDWLARRSMQVTG